MYKHLRHKLKKNYQLLFFFVLVFVVLGALLTFELKYRDRFYPGVWVGGVPVGGETYPQALGEFKQKVEELKTKGLSLKFEHSKGVREINIPMSATGLTPDHSIEYFLLGDWQSDLEEAYHWGRRSNPLASLGEQAILLFKKKNFNFSNTIQRDAVSSLLESELNSFLKKSMPAGFVLNSSKVSISPETTGEDITEEEVLSVLENKVANLDVASATFTAHEDAPRVTSAELEPFTYFVENFLKNTNLIFKYKGLTWQVKGPRLVTWLTMNEEGLISIDRVKLESYLASTVAKSIDNPPRNSRFKIQNGKLVEIVPGKKGFVVNIEKVLQEIDKIILETNLQFPSNTKYLLIETTEVEPRVTAQTINQYHIQDLVGEARTSFAGSSADREHNIRIGVATINGLLIPPGAEFSTVASIGRVTEKEGYVKELVIKENKTTKEFGGGLCQVATTLFRLALSAGLNITERMNHRFVVPYYNPPGLDATIYGPHPDLRFINDTNGYLLLQARVENKQVIMEFYGQKDGRTVEISEAYSYDEIPAPPTKYVPSAELLPGTTKCFEAPHDGLTTEVLYTVKYSDGTTKETNFLSIYQPWQKVCLVGTVPARSE